MDKLTLIVLLTIGFVIFGIGVRFRGTRYARWFVAVGILIVAVTIILRLVIGG